MCQFILIAVPIVAPHRELKQVFIEHGMVMREVDLPFLSEQIQDDDRLFIPSGASCDCDTVLGRMPVDTMEFFAEMITDYRKLRNWDETKVSHSRKRDDESRRSMAPEAQRWIDFIRSLLGIHGVTHVLMLLHNYFGRLEDEQIALDRTETKSIDNIDAAFMLGVENDVLYRFVT